MRYDVAMQRPDKLRVLQSGAGAANWISLFRSTDNGATWRDLGIVLEAPPGTLRAVMKRGFQNMIRPALAMS